MRYAQGNRAMHRLLRLILPASSGARAVGPLEAGRQVAAPADLRVLVAGGVLAAVAHQLDEEVRGELEGMPVTEVTVDVTNLLGSSTFNLPASLLLWSAGSLTGRPALRAAGGDLIRVLLMTQALVGPAKWLAGRERPDGSNNLSFPSGHTANAFAVARLMHLRHGRLAGWPLYGLGVLTAAGRLEDDRHYLSDVSMGGAVGIVAANCVVWASHAGHRMTLSPLPAPAA